MKEDEKNVLSILGRSNIAALVQLFTATSIDISSYPRKEAEVESSTTFFQYSIRSGWEVLKLIGFDEFVKNKKSEKEKKKVDFSWFRK